VTEARDRGWDRLSNGDLLDAAEAAGFEVLVTADKNIRYQQNLSGRRIAIVELGTPRWRAVLRHVEKVVAPVEISGEGLAWIGVLEGATFGVFSPAKGVHEGGFKVQNGVFSCHLAYCGVLGKGVLACKRRLSQAR